MTYEEGRVHLWRKPFQPVRIRLKDGRTFDVRYRNWTLAAETRLIIGVPSPDEPNSRYADRSVWVEWPEVAAIEPLSEAAAPAI